MSRILFLFIIGVLLTSCKEDIPIPKPRMYPKVEFPTKDSIVSFTGTECPLIFDMPAYYQWEQDTAFFDEKPKHPCWFDLENKDLKAELHCSYYPIRSREDLDELVNDAFDIAGKHNIKAEYRQESLIDNPTEKVHGLLFAIDGPVAAPIQFYLTDSTSHFFRASLYFNAKVDPDSTKVILDFVDQDIRKMIETFRWQ